MRFTPAMYTSLDSPVGHESEEWYTVHVRVDPDAQQLNRVAGTWLYGLFRWEKPPFVELPCVLRHIAPNHPSLSFVTKNYCAVSS